MHLLNLDSNLLLFGRDRDFHPLWQWQQRQLLRAQAHNYVYNRSSRFFQLFNDIERLLYSSSDSSSCGQSVFFINTTCIKMSRRSMRVGPQSTFVYMYTQVVVREEQCSEMIQNRNQLQRESQTIWLGKKKGFNLC